MRRKIFLKLKTAGGFGHRSWMGRSGAILLSVIWIILILSILAVGIARNSGVDASLVKHAIGQMKSYHAAWAGVSYAMDLIREDSKDLKMQTFDTIYECGIALNQKKLESVMKAVEVGEEQSFDIHYPSAQGSAILGFQDEDGKLNLNALTRSNYSLLSHLIEELGFSRNEADEVASAALDWQDPDDEPINQVNGAESDYYTKTAAGHLCKNRPFDDLSELLWLKGMRSEIFQKLKSYVTIYPKHAERLTVNFNTASVEVMRAVFNYAVENIAGLETNNVKSVVEKIVQYRNGLDGVPGTEDDRSLEVTGNIQKDMQLTFSQSTLYQMVLQAYHSPVSKFFRLRIVGVDKKSSIESHLDVVVERSPLAIVSWHRN